MSFAKIIPRGTRADVTSPNKFIWHMVNFYFFYFRAKKSALQTVFRVFQNTSGRFTMAKFFRNFFYLIDPPGGVGPIVRSSLSSV